MGITWSINQGARESPGHLCQVRSFSLFLNTWVSMDQRSHMQRVEIEQIEKDRLSLSRRRSVVQTGGTVRGNIVSSSVAELPAE